MLSIRHYCRARSCIFSHIGEADTSRISKGKLYFGLFFWWQTSKFDAVWRSERISTLWSEDYVPTVSAVWNMTPPR